MCQTVVVIRDEGLLYRTKLMQQSMQRDELFRQSIQIFPSMGNNGKRPMWPRASSARHATGMAHPREPLPFPYGTRPLGRNKFSRMSEKVRIFAP